MSGTETDAEATREEENEEKGNLLLSRRNAMRGGGALVALGIVGGGTVLLSNPVAAELEDPNDFVANGAQIRSEDGSVDGLAFGDRDDVDDDQLVLQYEGFNEENEDVDVELEVEVRGSDDDEDDDGWDGGQEEYETIAEGTGTFNTGNDLAGVAVFDWDTFDGDDLYAVTNDSALGNDGEGGHSEISNSDFEAEDDDNEDDVERTRVLDVRVSATIDGNETDAVPDGEVLEDDEETTATVIVTNRSAAIVGDDADGIGGQGSMQLDSDAEVDDSESVIE